MKVFYTGVLLASPALTAAFAAAPPPPKPDRWAPLRTLLDGWEFTQNYAISVGDANGQQFVYQGGNFTMDTQIPTGSTSKWPSAMMVAGLVNDGTIKSLDSPVSDYFDWWTSDPKDNRSSVTVRMLLTFTSGFGSGHPGQEMNTRQARDWRAKNDKPRVLSLHEHLTSEGHAEAAQACNMTTGEITKCARSIYETVKLIGKPGTVYSYNGNHLQIAGALAVAASGLPISEVVRKYLTEPYGMRHSYYEGKCPELAGSLVTTGADYEKFLSGLLTYKHLSKEIIDESEKDGTPFMADYYTLYGDYGFGHFLMCFDSIDGFTTKCKEAHCHMDPGAFGFIPIIDRKHNFYVQVVAAEIGQTGFYPLSGIPEYLAVAIKPHVDAIMQPAAMRPWSEEHLHYTPEFMSLGVADVNYCLNCVKYPKACS